MKLKLRQLELHVMTGAGMFGVRLPFKEGLIVLRADNTMGKSTCLQSIIYALGLDRMFGPSREVPLTPAMKSVIEEGGTEYPVVESNVLLEIENDRNEILTLQRSVVGQRDTKLISAWDGPLLTAPTSAKGLNQRDYFVLDPGAATRRDGFHYALAQFIGWELPLVPRYNGGESPLYMECIFPLMMVEQKRGWSSLQAHMPTYFGIQDVGKRAIEFVASLDAYKHEVMRQRILQEEGEIRSQWKSLLKQVDTLARPLGGVAKSIPSLPVASWPPPAPPELFVYRNEEWVSLEKALHIDRERLRQLEREVITTSEAAAPQATNELNALQSALDKKEFAYRELFGETNAERSQHEAIERRLRALEEDLRQHLDAKKLRALGSVSQLKVTTGSCPTCHQSIAESLISQEQMQKVMTIEDNIDFIKGQKHTFERMLADSARVLEVKERQLNGLRAELEEHRARIRALKATLISSSKTPSIAAVRERVELEQRIQHLDQFEESFQTMLAQFAQLAGQWLSIAERRAQLPDGALSPTDESKLAKLESLFIDQLRQYGFKSFPVQMLSLSRETYKPTREGFDLGFDISASDNIRVIWAYLNALLELARYAPTNHIGLLMLDEPRQQDTSEISFGQLLRRASNAGRFGQQVLFATSETKIHILEMLGEIPHQLLDFNGKILTRLSAK